MATVGDMIEALCSACEIDRERGETLARRLRELGCLASDPGGRGRKGGAEVDVADVALFVLALGSPGEPKQQAAVASGVLWSLPLVDVMTATAPSTEATGAEVGLEIAERQLREIAPDTLGAFLAWVISDLTSCWALSIGGNSRGLHAQALAGLEFNGQAAQVTVSFGDTVNYCEAGLQSFVMIGASVVEAARGLFTGVPSNSHEAAELLAVGTA